MWEFGEGQKYEYLVIINNPKLYGPLRWLKNGTWVNSLNQHSVKIWRSQDSFSSNRKNRHRKSGYVYLNFRESVGILKYPVTVLRKAEKYAVDSKHEHTHTHTHHK